MNIFQIMHALSQRSTMETEIFDESTICNPARKRKSAAVETKKTDEINGQPTPRRSTCKRKSEAIVEAKISIEVKKPLTNYIFVNNSQKK
jgi:hypothetical protein